MIHTSQTTLDLNMFRFSSALNVKLEVKNNLSSRNYPANGLWAISYLVHQKHNEGKMSLPKIFLFEQIIVSDNFQLAA